MLTRLRGRYRQKELAYALEVDVRTLRRWEVGESDPPPYLADAIRQRLLPLASPTHKTDAAFTFIDLFAGIGGIRMGFEAHGGRCVFTSEWNSYAQKTYLENFPDASHTFVGDITQVDENDIPDHDVLLAGFPCQPFSIAGVSKKNALGRAHGFADETQGTLFFDVARILKAKRPRAFLLENVKNLVSHDKGNTFRVIQKVLREDLGYHIHCKVIDGQHFVPQHRERILVVGFREATDFSWDDLQLPKTGPRLNSILHPQDGSEAAEAPFTSGIKAKVDAKYTLTPRLWTYLQEYAAKHRAAGNGFGFGLVNSDSVSRTLSARYYKDGSEILLAQGPRKRPRRLTPRECARLMGLPDSFKIPVSDTQAYQLLAEAAVAPMIETVAKLIASKLRIKEATVTDIPNISPHAFATVGNWTQEQLKLAFHFYCQTPFGKLHSKNPEIIKLASLIGRTPSALAMKLVNFASLDPSITSSGRKGLSGASALDRTIWREFHNDWEGLAVECEQLHQYLLRENGIKPVPTLEKENDFSYIDFTGETRLAFTQQRIKQNFFRRAVLSSYRERCCISGVSDARLLVASHIVPWSVDKANRLNPSNGLCLSAIHDKAFDSYLFTLSNDRRIVLSEKLKTTKDKFLREVFWPTADKQIELPERFLPDPSLVELHRKTLQDKQTAA
ncbi:DNA (cytosine-5-)-methyltransferase [Pseudolysobacter antarcticus]|uniref:DNA (cytosine-5-)-methyltransferase n=1 Tax=Pseudolysobacter antarcticus TaxID=2511995 RepID=UPI00241400C5|nr:DNA (cytosine-5-)-methyltransferase [Pseudolysobacter antarcticus]